MRYKLNTKPMSVNKARQGQRFKTQDYKHYERVILALLPKSIDIKDTKKMELYMKRGFSSTLADTSNPIKLFEDILQKAYGIDDRYFRRLVVEKEVVKKGQEYIEFEIKHFT